MNIEGTWGNQQPPGLLTPWFRCPNMWSVFLSMLRNASKRGSRVPELVFQTKLSPHNPRPYDINFFSSAWGLALGWLMRHLFHIFRFEMRTLCGGRSCGLNFSWMMIQCILHYDMICYHSPPWYTVSQHTTIWCGTAKLPTKILRFWSLSQRGS